MKYYIPLSSLNLDNILQAESISPVSFYEKRETGYKSFEVLPQLRGIDPIVLFKRPVYIPINDNRYNFPILIEIEDESQLTDSSVLDYEEGIILYYNTLKITPYNCRIFFFSENEYKLTTINTKDNKSAKYYTKYQIYPTINILEELIEIPIIKPASYQLSFKKNNETEYDKNKGIAYSYLLGQSLSLSSELAYQKWLTQELYNTFAGIKAFINSNEEIPQTYLNKFKDQYETYKKIDQIESKNQSLFKASLLEEVSQYEIDPNNLINLLNLWDKDIWNFIINKLSYRYKASLLPVLSDSPSFTDLTHIMNEVENHTITSIESYKENVPKPNLNSLKLESSVISLEGKYILNIVIKYIIDSKLTPEKLSSNRAGILTKIINIIRDFFISNLGYTEEQWMEDPHRKYALKLYNYLIDYKNNFYLNDALNLTFGTEFLTIAAFILRGESYDSYIKYLSKHQVVDYSLPLALWGALCGYMEMNRTILYDFLTDEVYETVYKFLNGTDIYKANFKNLTSNIENSDCTPINDSIRLEDYLFVLKRAKVQSVYTKLSNNLSKEFISLNDIDDILKTSGKRQFSYCQKAKQIFISIAQKDYEELRKMISPKKEWPKVFELLKKDLGSTDVTTQANDTSALIIQNNDEKPSVLEKNNKRDETILDSILLQKGVLLNEVLIFISDPETRKQVTKDINWFVDNYGNPQSKYYKNALKSNHNIIKNLEKNFLNKSRSYSSMIYELYVPIDKIIEHLKKKYDN